MNSIIFIVIALLFILAGCSEHKSDEKRVVPTKDKDISVKVSKKNNESKSEFESRQETTTNMVSEKDLAEYAKRIGVSDAIATKLLAKEVEMSQRLPTYIASEGGVAELKEILRQASKALSSKDLLQNSDPDIINGSRLPSSFIEVFYPKSQSEKQDLSVISKAGFLGVDEKLIIEQRMLLGVVRQLTAARPDIVISMLQEQAEKLPPSVTDFILFHSVSEGLMESPSALTERGEPNQTASRFIEFMQLSHAKNPVYRLLSVHISYITLKDEDKVTFYTSYLSEPDPTIRLAVIDGLEAIRSEMTIDLLAGFENQARQAGESEIANTARLALTRLTNELKQIK